MSPVVIMLIGIVIALVAHTCRKIIHIPTPLWTFCLVFSIVGAAVFLAGLLIQLNPILEKL